MGQLDKHLADARRRLMRPSRASLDDGDLADYCIESIDQLVIDLNAGTQPFFLQTARIDVVSGQAIYALNNVPNFGRARYLYTMDDSDPNHQRRPINIVSYESLMELYGGGDPLPTLVSPSPMPHTAAAAAFYYLREAPGPGDVIEFGPVPNQSASYKMIFEPDVVRPQARQDIGFRLAQFDGYVAALTAVKALPHCTWKGLDKIEAAARKKDISATLMYDIGSVQDRRGYAWQFWCYSQSNTQRSEPTVVGWAEERW